MEASQRTSDLRTLYGNTVLKYELVEALNNGIDSLTHYVGEDELARYLADQEGLRMFGVQRLVEVRREKELAPDEKPTLSRFFTLRDTMDNLLTMEPTPEGRSEMIKLANANPQKKMAGRMGWVQKLYETPGTSQYLRRTALCLQITGHLHTFCANLERKEGEAPLLARLAQGHGRRKLRETFGKVCSPAR